jgi:hypothetical protein
LAQPPQCCGSLLVFTHELPQAVSPAPQPARHMAFEHTCEPVHALVHEPQWVGSVLRFTQLEPHIVSPGPHVQFPPEHTAPLPQTLPQLPQSFGSVLVSTHVMLQLVPPLGQKARHVPDWHCCVAEHVVVQLPQCALFELTSTHVPPQSICPVGHWHVPLTQLWPPAHA